MSKVLRFIPSSLVPKFHLGTLFVIRETPFRANLCLLALTCAVLLTACSQMTEANLEKIHNGMTTDEVKAILGEPTDSQTKSMLGISSTTFSYHTGSSNVAITFIDNKVIATEGDFK